MAYMEKELAIVNKKIAKDLKEIGFDWLCVIKYHNEDDTLFYDINNTADTYLKAPRQAYAIKWLRDVKKIKVLIIHSPSGMYNFEIYKWNYDNNLGLWERIGNMCHYETYELAEAAGIEKSIEILNEKK